MGVTRTLHYKTMEYTCTLHRFDKFLWSFEQINGKKKLYFPFFSIHHAGILITYSLQNWMAKKGVVCVSVVYRKFIFWRWSGRLLGGNIASHPTSDCVYQFHLHLHSIVCHDKSKHLWIHYKSKYSDSFIFVKKFYWTWFFSLCNRWAV